MITIRTLGAAAEVLEERSAADAVEAEAMYWRAVAGPLARGRRTLVLEGDGLAPASYRLDMEWPADRETAPARWARLWATPAQLPGRWPGITATDLRGLLAAAGWTQGEAARQIAIGDRQMRKWCADGSMVSWASWYALRELALATIRGGREA